MREVSCNGMVELYEVTNLSQKTRSDCCRATKAIKLFRARIIYRCMPKYIAWRYEKVFKSTLITPQIYVFTDTYIRVTYKYIHISDNQYNIFTVIMYKRKLILFLDSMRLNIILSVKVSKILNFQNFKLSEKIRDVKI